MSTRVEIIKDSNSFVSVACDDQWLHDELYDMFKIPISGVNTNHTRHTHDRFYDKYRGRLPLGLLGRALVHCRNYEVVLDPSLKNLRPYTDADVREWMDSVEFPFTPYEYQYNIVSDAIRLRRVVALADTGAGKSAVLYFLTRFYIDEDLAEQRDGKTLIIIPNITLRSQIISDFESYGWEDARGWCHVIESGGPKWSDKRVVITTWQSVQNMDEEYFEQFTHVVVDEVHGVSAKKQTNMLKRCTRASDRVGLTGTLDGTLWHKTKVEQFVGPCKRYVATQELTEIGQVCPTQVFMLGLKYTPEETKRLNKLDYPAKVDFINCHKHRMELLCSKLTKLTSCGDNILAIFEKVEKGLNLYLQHLQELGLSDKVVVITGAVSGPERDAIKARLEAETGLILLSTWGALSTGVSIKNIHTLALMNSSKGKIRVLQTVGRMLRVHESKQFAKILDITDITTNDSNKHSPFLDHSKLRLGYYKEKGHPVRFVAPLSLSHGVDEHKYIQLLDESSVRKNRDS